MKNPKEEERCSEVIEKCLTLVQSKGLKSIAFPLIGTGSHLFEILTRIIFIICYFGFVTLDIGGNSLLYINSDNIV